MSDQKILKALYQHTEILRASIEVLEIKFQFLDDYLKENEPEVYDRYQYYLYDKLKAAQKERSTALGSLFSDFE